MANRNQDIATPQGFVKAVESYFNIKFKYDMAANSGNTKAPYYYFDSLNMDWPLDEWCWLNPPFKYLSKWIKKCDEQAKRGCKIISIWPLSGDKNTIPAWSNACVRVIHGRIWPEVRSLMLCDWYTDYTYVEGLVWDKHKETLSREW